MDTEKTKYSQIIAAFVFGVIFVSVILFLTFFSHSVPLDDNRMWIIRIVMALAAAGVAAILPGFIDLEGKIPWLNVTVVRAGGALAVFCLVLFSPIHKIPNPEDPLEDIYIPSAPASKTATAWIDAISASDYKKAFSLASTIAKQHFTEEDTASMVSPIIIKLGKLEDKIIYSANSFTSPPAPGLDKSAYSHIIYKAKFSDYPRDVYIDITLLGEEESQGWRIIHFNFLEMNENRSFVQLNI